MKDPKYLAWICEQHCIVCGRMPCEAHHQDERSKKMMGKKCSDRRAVPLCVYCHRLYHDKLGWRLYKRHWIGVELTIQNLREKYLKERLK